MRKRKKTMLLLAVFLALLFLSGGGAAVTVAAQDAAGSRTEGGEDPSSGKLTEEEMDMIRRADKNCRLVKGQVFLWPGAKGWEDLWDVDGTITR